MIAILHGAEFHIPDELVDQYILNFMPLKKYDNRDSLIDLRDDILDILDVVMQDPEALYDPEFLGEFIETLAMRHALQKIGILHDA